MFQKDHSTEKVKSKILQSPMVNKRHEDSDGSPKVTKRNEYSDDSKRKSSSTKLFGGSPESSKWIETLSNAIGLQDNSTSFIIFKYLCSVKNMIQLSNLKWEDAQILT
jgi:hypothetical protein